MNYLKAFLLRLLARAAFVEFARRGGNEHAKQAKWDLVDAANRYDPPKEFR